MAEFTAPLTRSNTSKAVPAFVRAKPIYRKIVANKKMVKVKVNLRFIAPPNGSKGVISSAQQWLKLEKCTLQGGWINCCIEGKPAPELHELSKFMASRADPWLIQHQKLFVTCRFAAVLCNG